MQTIETKREVDAGLLADELALSVPELAPTPTGPDGRMEGRVVVEQVSNEDFKGYRIHVDDEADLDDVKAVLKRHRPRPMAARAVVDRRAEAVGYLRSLADRSEPTHPGTAVELARALLTILGED